jgi:alpha-tubulin suppressor-like RCC1 family protein
MVDASNRKPINGRTKALTGLVVAFTLTATGVAMATPSSSPTAVQDLTESTMAVAGVNTSQVIASDGKRYSKGNNQYSQLGVKGDTAQEWTPGVGDLSWSKISAPYENSVGLTTDGQLYTWGSNRYGALGNGNEQPKATPQKIEVGYTFTAISAGADFVVGLDASGNLFTWGANSSGQLGDGSTTATNAPKLVAFGTQFNSVKAGKNYVLALDKQNRLWSWGANEAGQLGNGNTEPVNVPTLVSEQTWKQIATNSTSTTSAGLDDNGALYTWGNNDNGQLANGTDWRQEQLNENARAAAEIKAIQDADAARRANLIQQCRTVRADALAAENARLRAEWQKEQDEARAKKDAEDAAKAAEEAAKPKPTPAPGATPTPTPTFTPEPFEPTRPLPTATPDPNLPTCEAEVDSTFKATDTSNIKPAVIPEPALSGNVATPAMVSSVRSYNVVAVGTQNGFAVDVNGRMYGWGADKNGQTGLNLADDVSHTQLPVPVNSQSKFTSVDTGNGFAAAIDRQNRLYTWGSPEDGALATGAGDAVTSPNIVAQNMKSVATGERTGYSLGNDGTVHSWGKGANGLLGDGGTADRNSVASANYAANQISAGATSVSSLNQANQLTSFGVNTGTFGNSKTSKDTQGPTTLLIKEFKDVSAGRYSGLAVDLNGIVWAWGLGTQGQTGVSGTESTLTPVMVPMAATAKLVTSGLVTSYAVTDDNKVYMWGLNGDKNLREIANTADIKEIAAGDQHLVAVDADGNLLNWGPNSFGAIGEKDAASMTAVPVDNVKFKSVAAGGYSSAAISTDGQLYGWGDNSGKQLLLDLPTISEPTVLESTNKYKSVSVSRTHMLTVDEDNVVYGWGTEPYGTFSGGQAVQDEPFVLPIVIDMKENN